VKAADVKAVDVKGVDATVAEVAAADVKGVDATVAEVAAADVKPKDVTPDLPAIKNAVAVLKPGDVTDFVPVEKGGGLVAVLEKRAPADPSGFAAAKAQYETQYLSQSRSRAFIEWLRDRRRAAGISVATG
jgi:hypothetical protein